MQDDKLWHILFIGHAKRHFYIFIGTLVQAVSISNATPATKVRKQEEKMGRSGIQDGTNTQVMIQLIKK